MSNGETYVGDFVHGKYFGQGTATFVSPHEHAGGKYVG
jgi:hypothetical protein